MTTQTKALARPMRQYRRDTFLRGVIEITGRPSMTCAVRELSPASALLIVPTSVALPARFGLSVEAKNLYCGCDLLSQRHDIVEVCFYELRSLQRRWRDVWALFRSHVEPQR
jgi:hypothetical protein